MNDSVCDPVLTCADSSSFEDDFFAGNEEKEWKIMNQVGNAIGDALLRDMRELRSIPPRPRFLALVGKGHNGGDALLGLRRLLKTIPTARAVVWPLREWKSGRPNLIRARAELMESANQRVQEISPISEMNHSENIRKVWEERVGEGGFEATLEGILGMQAKLPLKSPLLEWIRMLNEDSRLGVRVSVDMPTGVGEDETVDAFKAHFTYCTGIVKTPVLVPKNQNWVGRLRYLEVGFFNHSSNVFSPDRGERVLKPNALRTLRGLRPVPSDKRSNGHLLLLAGSRNFAGAAMMAAQGALKAGVGLLSVCIPESLHSSFSAQRPEAMWIPMPETPEGGLALEGLGKVRSLLGKVSAVAAGPGLGREPETLSLVRETLSHFSGRALLDADALQTELLNKIAQTKRLVLTPHAGEYQRISQGQSPLEYAEEKECVLVLKGSHTRIFFSGILHHCLGGSSLLARGGSGDLLAGILGALLAKNQFDALTCSLLGVQWHGRAAEILARQKGQESVYATEILDYLSFALRNDF